MPDKGKRLTADPSKIKYADDVLLGKYLTEALSDTFIVLDTPVRLIAFGLTTDKVEVLRVWRPATNTHWDKCGDLQPGGEVFEMPYKVGCVNVAMNKDVTELVIDGRGEYRLQYVGDNRLDVHVVMHPDKVVAVNDTVRGIQCACCKDA